MDKAKAEKIQIISGFIVLLAIIIVTIYAFTRSTALGLIVTAVFVMMYIALYYAKGKDKEV